MARLRQELREGELIQPGTARWALQQPRWAALPLEPNSKAVVKLPRRTGCRIAVTSINEAEGASERLELDACKVRVVRLVN